MAKEKLSKQELFELTSKGIDYAIAQGIANKKDKDAITYCNNTCI